MAELDFEFEFDDERYEVERLLVDGDVVEPGQVAFRLSRSDGLTAPHVEDLVVPFAGVFRRADGWGIVRAAEMEVDGKPVGLSYEVKAVNAAQAENNARRKSLAAGRLPGRLLWTDQLEAGTFEVVFAELEREPLEQPVKIGLTIAETTQATPPPPPESLYESVATYLYLNGGAGSKRTAATAAQVVVNKVWAAAAAAVLDA